jgi:O-antigen/teichoic acid export membrane protein
VIWAVTADLWKGQWKQEWVGTIFKFGLPFIPAGLGHATNEMLDRFLLNNMDPSVAERLYGTDITPEDVVGIYNACYKLAVFMLLIVQMYRMAWQPFFMRYSKDDDSATLFSRAFVYFNAFAAVAYLVVSLFREQIVAINVPVLNATLINSNYWAGLEIVPLLLLAYWFQGWYINFSSGIFIKEKTSVLYKITLLGAGITLAANLVLIPYFGMMGSASATLASYGVMAFVLGIYSKRVMEVTYHMPSSFGLMLFCVTLVYTAPAASVWFNVSIMTGNAFLMIPGLVAIGGYIYFTEKKTLTET